MASFNPSIPFAKRLILNQYLLSLFGVRSLDELSVNLKNTLSFGLSEDDQTYFHHALVQTIPHEECLLSIDKLAEYDQNIILHTDKIRGTRSESIRWKYFQYLALLFTEIYLDRYFNIREQFRTDLNEFRRQQNQYLPSELKVDSFEHDDMNRLAFWSATGSGKTLIMHANLKQFLWHLEQKNRRHEINRILLITPNEGLSDQHLNEFGASNIFALPFTKRNPGLHAGSCIEVLEITKLGEEEGDKTVDIESFESNNLIFVDEAHRGAKGTVWYNRRRELARKGFAFEYSATIGQAVANDKKLDQEYSRSILFDYSYKHFYNDGFGKDYRILNLKDEGIEDEDKSLYLTACLLAFFQQKMLFRDARINAEKFNIADPLIVFVGSSVTKETRARDFSDIIEIILFIARFVNTANKQKVISRIKSAMSGRSGLLDSEGREVFFDKFPYLTEHGYTASQAYESILAEIFNSNSGAKLHVELIKSSDEEIGLHLGNSEIFGVINVGDAPKLFRKCQNYISKEGLSNLMNFSEKTFASTIFNSIDKPNSQTNVLIGSKKFTEGWNCLRVSTMGLMNIGRNEGTQIIQLFGRGVRLMGYKNMLMRHNALNIDGIRHDRFLSELETLNIFGIRSDYMEQFKLYIEDEGIKAESNMEEIVLPVIKNLERDALKMIRLKDDKNFVRDGDRNTLSAGAVKNNEKVSMDFYTQIQTNISRSMSGSIDALKKDKGNLTEDHLEFVDFEKIYFSLLEMKCNKGWHNLAIEMNCLQDILLDHSWYEILIPSEYLKFGSAANIKLWQKIAWIVIQRYCDLFYKMNRNLWETKFREYYELEESNPNLIDEYEISLPKSEMIIVNQLNELKGAIDNKNLPNTDQIFGRPGDEQGRAIIFDRHLYQPLLFSKKQLIKVGVAVLNEGEKQFVLDLRKFYQANREFFKNKNLYLLRNLSIGKGIGFFDAGNFFPDFILWMICEGKQHICFVDPKGIFYLNPDNPKLEFYKKIKDIQQRMEDESVVLNSFIVSVTPHDLVKDRFGGMTQSDFASAHVFFQQDENYIAQIFDSMN